MNDILTLCSSGGCDSTRTTYTPIGTYTPPSGGYTPPSGTVPPRVALAPPRSVTAASCDRCATVTWLAPTFGLHPAGYEVQFKKKTETAWGVLTTADTSVLLGGLTNAERWDVRVRSLRLHLVSGWRSATVTPGRVPDAPPAPTVARAANRTLTVSWTPPHSYGSAVTDYDIQYRRCTATDKTCATSPTWTTWSNLSHYGTSTKKVRGGLTNGTAYQFKVRAQNRFGESAWSAEGQGTPKRPDRLECISGAGKVTFDWAGAVTESGGWNRVFFQVKLPNQGWKPSQYWKDHTNANDPPVIPLNSKTGWDNLARTNTTFEVASSASGSVSGQARFWSDTSEILVAGAVSCSPLDAPTAGFTSTERTADEDDGAGTGGSVDLTVRLSKEATTTGTVNYGTVNGVAVGVASCPADGSPAADYEHANGQLVFSPGDREKTVTVQFCPDDIEEAESEAFTVELRTPSATINLGTDTTATITITDTDQPVVVPT